MTRNSQEQRLATFVDRVKEMNMFQRFLDPELGEKPIMFIWGQGGYGKSSLLSRMLQECNQRTMKKSQILWSNSDKPDYLSAMRKIRDDLGSEHFLEFNDKVNYFTKEGYELRNNYQVTVLLKADGKVEVGNGMNLEGGSQVTNMAGVLIQDLKLVVPRPDKEIHEDQRMKELTTTFLFCLNRLASAQAPVVIFMDAVEKMTLSTSEWVWEQLLKRACENELPHVRFVMLGRVGPSLENGNVYLMMEKAELGPLGLSDIEQYLRVKGVREDLCSPLALMLHGVSKGFPLQVAAQADEFLNNWKG